jgi:hypothetical protein
MAGSTSTAAASTRRSRHQQGANPSGRLAAPCGSRRRLPRDCEIAPIVDGSDAPRWCTAICDRRAAADRLGHLGRVDRLRRAHSRAFGSNRISLRLTSSCRRSQLQSRSPRLLASPPRLGLDQSLCVPSPIAMNELRNGCPSIDLAPSRARVPKNSTGYATPYVRRPWPDSPP